MPILRTAARPLLAGIFISGGYDAFRNPGTKVEKAETVAPRLAAPLPLPDDTEQLVRINGAVQVVAGTALALGVLPRVAAFTLAASLLPTTAAGHRFWEMKGADRAQQRIHFLKNAAIFGGLLLEISCG